MLLVGGKFALAGDWAGVRSGSVLVAGQTSEGELRTVAGRLEKFRSAIGALSPRLLSDAVHPVNVLIFSDDLAFRTYGLKRENGTFDDAVAGFFVRGEDANYIAISGASRTSNTYHTLFHEYSHNVLRSRGTGEIPAWLNEGLSQYLETAEFDPDGKLVLGLPPRGRLELLAKSELMPLKKLLSVTNDEVHVAGGAPRTVFYAQSWLLVHKLLSSVAGTSFKERLERIYEISADQAAIEKLIGEKAAGAGPESGLRGYAAIRPATQAYEMQADDSSTAQAVAEQISPARADTLLGELLLRLGRTAEAEVLIKKALAAEINSARANAALGEILSSRGKYPEARTALEAAERAGELGPGSLFHLAYALVKETADKDQLIEKIPPATADRARGYLMRAIQLRPSFVEPYKLLGHIALINNDQLREGAAQLRTAAALRPGDVELQLMLGKTYLRLEQYRDAGAIAEAIATAQASPAIKKEALEIQSAASEYKRVSLDVSTGSEGKTGRNILFLKRSWLTDEDLKQIELSREISNLNVALDRPRSGEVQVIGTIERISCANGAITYSVLSNGAPLKLSSSKFEGLRLAVLVQGMHSFKLDCGARFPGQKAVLSYKPATPANAAGRQELTSVTFVPENFQLMSSSELAAVRLIVIEDDMRLRGRERESLTGYSRVSVAERLESIRSSLRKPGPSEKQILGRIERVDCSASWPLVKVTAEGREWQFTAPSLGDVVANWFTSTSLNFRLECGSEAAAPNVLLTYRTNNAIGPHELTAIEFVPVDLTLTASGSGPAGRKD
jgi:thioredoxin-like negative regulator of GroEL